MNISKSYKKLLSLFAALLAVAVLLLGGCGADDKRDDIIVLYTNDVHCSIDDDIGYDGLAAYKKQCKEVTPYVALVDCGDALHGGEYGTVSQGEYPAELMKRAGYDFAVLGDQEFGYGLERLAALMEKSGAQYLGCNITYTGAGESAFLSKLLPCKTVTYGNVKVAFVGVSAPESIVKSVPGYFSDQSGNYVYDFCGAGGQTLYGRVQENVDACINGGADYVIALTHLGTDATSSPFTSRELIANTKGINAVLDGNSPDEISCEVIKNAEGKNVLLSSTGARLSNIGRLTITAGGNIAAGLIESYPDKDGEVTRYITGIKEGLADRLKQSVGTSEVALTILSETGARLIRTRETNLGDFCADAYRMVSGADIALVNGGGIRADIAAGEVTYGDILSVHPYGNSLCAVKATGREILNALEMASRSCTATPGEGESGAFLQVSGLKYTINTTVQSTVETDEQGNFRAVGEKRRVENVQVLGKDGNFTAIDPDKEYTVASHNYLLKQGGDGLNMFMDNAPILDSGMLDCEVLINYLSTNLGGVVGATYASPQNRITIIT